MTSVDIIGKCVWKRKYFGCRNAKILQCYAMKESFKSPSETLNEINEENRDNFDIASILKVLQGPMKLLEICGDICAAKHKHYLNS